MLYIFYFVIPSFIKSYITVYLIIHNSNYSNSGLIIWQVDSISV